MVPRGKKGIWVAEFWHNDQHCRRTLKTSNKKIAHQRAVQLEAVLASGTYKTAPPAVTVRQAADDYLGHLETKGRAKRTMAKYRGVLSIFIEIMTDLGVTKLGQVSPTHFDRFQAARKQAGRHPNTIYKDGEIVLQLFGWAKTRRLLAENPLADVKVSKPRLEPRGGPSLADVDRILEALPEPDRTLVAVLAFSGMRSGELRHLTPVDLDLEGNWFEIVSRVGAETKTRRSRKVPIHSRLRPLLSDSTVSGRRWLFTAPARSMSARDDRPVNVNKLNERFLSTLERLGLPAGRRSGGFTLHSLRHFFETFTVNNRIPQRVVDAWLGHSSDKSMGTHYYELTDEYSQRHMEEVPFGTGMPAANAGEKGVADEG
jgi:integrase